MALLMFQLFSLSEIFINLTRSPSPRPPSSCWTVPALMAGTGRRRTVWRWLESSGTTTGAGATRVEVSYQVVIQSPIRLSSDRKDEFYHVKRDTTSAAVTATVELHFSIEFYILMHSVDKPDSR